jgi:hypothetical protein
VVNLVALNNQQHKHLRVITARGAEFGENVHLLPVIADELSKLVLDYPVCMTKDPETGRFGLTALLGFDAGENLFLDGNRWKATYVPLHVRRQPFMVGFSRDQEGNKTSDGAVITLDLDSSRVQETEGEFLFNEDGSNSKFLDAVSDILSSLMSGIEATKAFIETLSSHDLIEPAQINITFADGEQKRYDGLYTVNDEKLHELSADVLLQMYQNGYLQACILLNASVGHVSKLIGWKNALRPGPGQE